MINSNILEEIETGYSDFDKNFTVKSIDGSFVHNMLTSSIITYLCQIKQFNPNIIIDKGKIILWLPIVFNKKRDYESLINIVFLLCDRLKELNFSFIALLFGSYVEKKSKKSDIDLLIITEKSQEIKDTLSLIPLKIHPTIINYKEFIDMIKTKEFSVVSEVIKKNIILINIEEYYRLIQNVG